jgi:hypothetical protein
MSITLGNAACDYVEVVVLLRIVRATVEGNAIGRGAAISAQAQADARRISRALRSRTGWSTGWSTGGSGRRLGGAAVQKDSIYRRATIAQSQAGRHTGLVSRAFVTTTVRLAAAITTNLENALFNDSVNGATTQNTIGSRPGHGQCNETPENEENGANNGHSESLQSFDISSMQLKIVRVG